MYVYGLIFLSALFLIFTLSYFLKSSNGDTVNSTPSTEDKVNSTPSTEDKVVSFKTFLPGVSLVKNCLDGSDTIPIDSSKFEECPDYKVRATCPEYLSCIKNYCGEDDCSDKAANYCNGIYKRSKCRQDGCAKYKLTKPTCKQVCAVTKYKPGNSVYDMVGYTLVQKTTDNEEDTCWCTKYISKTKCPPTEEVNAVSEVNMPMAPIKGVSFITKCDYNSLLKTGNLKEIPTKPKLSNGQTDWDNVILNQFMCSDKCESMGSKYYTYDNINGNKKCYCLKTLVKKCVGNVPTARSGFINPRLAPTAFKIPDMKVGDTTIKGRWNPSFLIGGIDYKAQLRRNSSLVNDPPNPKTTCLTQMAAISSKYPSGYRAKTADQKWMGWQTTPRHCATVCYNYGSTGFTYNATNVKPIYKPDEVDKDGKPLEGAKAIKDYKGSCWCVDNPTKSCIHTFPKALYRIDDYNEKCVRQCPPKNENIKPISGNKLPGYQQPGKIGIVSGAVGISDRKFDNISLVHNPFQAGVSCLIKMKGISDAYPSGYKPMFPDQKWGGWQGSVGSCKDKCKSLGTNSFTYGAVDTEKNSGSCWCSDFTNKCVFKLDPPVYDIKDLNFDTCIIDCDPKPGAKPLGTTFANPTGTIITGLFGNYKVDLKADNLF